MDFPTIQYHYILGQTHQHPNYISNLRILLKSRPSLLPQRNLPRPNIHANLIPTRNRQPSMDGPMIPHPISIQILPVNRVPLHRAERNPLIPGLITVHHITPFLVPRRVDKGEMCPPAGGIVPHVDVGEETRETVAAVDGELVGWVVDEPVGVEAVVFAGGVVD